MKFVEAELEKRRPCDYKKLKNELETFMRMNVKTAKVIYTKSEYSCATSAGASCRRGAKYIGLPIKVNVRNGNVYLIRTDL